MSEITDRILSAVGDGARDVAAIEAATGLERTQIYTGIHTLKANGEVAKDADGYTLGGAETPRRPRIHEASATAAPPPERKRCKAGKAKAAKPAKGNGAAHPVIRPGNGHDDAPIAFARFGEYVVLKREDVAALLATLERWRAVVDA